MFFNKRYSKVRLIDRGGMSDVYLGWDHLEERHVAIKVLDRELAKNPAFKKRFLSEIKLMQKIQSRFVVQIYDIHWTDDIQFIVMEYVEGLTLKKYIAQKGIPSDQEALRIMAQICIGVQDIHNKGIVHRDIKSQNVIVTNTGLVKIIDLGIAKDDESLDLTKTGVIIASLQYVAPEIIGLQKATPQSDIYAIGILFFFLMCGKTPFMHENDYEVLNQHNTKPLPDMKRTNRKIKKIILQATAKNPEERQQSAAEVYRQIIKIAKV